MSFFHMSQTHHMEMFLQMIIKLIEGGHYELA